MSADTEMIYERLISSLEARAAVGEHRTMLVKADGSKAGWSLIRRHILARDSAICAECSGPATEVDHIWPRRWGGQNILENLQALCATCNRRKGQSIDWDRAANHNLTDLIRHFGSRSNADMAGNVTAAVTLMFERVWGGSMPKHEATEAIARLVMQMQAALDQANTWRHELERMP